MNSNTQTPETSDIVIDVAKTSISDLWTKEDYWAIWLGFLLLIFGMIIYFPNPPEDMHQKISQANEILQSESDSAPFKTTAWYKAADDKLKLKANSVGFGKKLKSYVAMPHGWKTNPLDAFIMNQETADAKNAAALPAYETAKSDAGSLLKIAQLKEAAAKSVAFKNEKWRNRCQYCP